MWEERQKSFESAQNKHGKQKNRLLDDSSSIQARDETDNEEVRYVCRWKCCCFWSILVTAIVLLVFFCLLFWVIVPNMAQSAANNSILTQLNMQLSNATSNSIFMNVTLQLENTGSFDATIKSSKAKGYTSDGQYIGTIQLPKIIAKANKGAIFQIQQPLMIENVTNFQNFAKLLLSGQNSGLRFKAKPSLEATVAGISVSTTVTMDHTLSIQGSAMQNPVSSNFTVLSATKDKITGLSQISFSTASQMKLGVTNVRIELYGKNWTKLGYTDMDSLTIISGYNFLDKLPTYLVKTSNNQGQLEEFIGNFMMGINQEMYIYGPVPKTQSTSSVIDYCINTTVLNMGSTAGNTAINGMITSESQSGWKVTNGSDSWKVRGAYSTIKNPLNVPIRLTALEVDLNFLEEIAWGFDKQLFEVWNVLIGNCSATTALAHLHIGYGMYKHNFNKTYVDFDANAATSFFAIAEPQYNQFGWGTENETDCVIAGILDEGFPCCFLTEQLAAICKENPGLKNSTSSELQEDFLTAKLDSNMTLLIDKKFEVTVSYFQDFFPIYYGVEVYKGYVSDLFLDCPNIAFPTWPQW